MQVLKEEVRNAILESVRSEVLNYGVSNVSLRRIARNIGMSPSNIYNYYPGKEALIDAIVESTVKDIDELLKELTDNMVEFNLQNVNDKKGYISVNVEQLALRLMTLFKGLDESVLIILGSEKYLKNIQNWLEDLLYSNYDSFFVRDDNSASRNMMVKLIAPAIIQGLYICVDSFDYCEKNNVDISELMTHYLGLFLN